MAIPEAFYIWLISEVAGPQISAGVTEQLKPGWQRRLAKAAIGLSGVEVSKRKLRKWLSMSAVWERLVRSQPADVADLVESLNEIVATDWRQRRVSAADAAQRTQRLMDALVAQFLSELDPSLAQNVAHYREMWQLRKLDAGQQEIRAILEDRGRFDVHVGRLPPPTAQSLHDAYEESPVQAAQLATYLSDPTSDPEDLIRHVWSEQPQWLLEGSYLILVAVAEFASAHDYPEIASEVFETVADQTSPDRRRWLARAGLAAANHGDTARAADLVSRAQDASSRSHPFVEFVAALLSEEAGRVLSSVNDELLSSEGDRAMALSSRAQAQQINGQFDEAIETLQTLLDERPNVTSALLLQARLLVDRASSERSDSRYVDLKAAMDLCLRARDERRRWRGNSAEAAALASEIAFNLGERHEVLRLGLPSPEGEATDSEASHAPLVSLVALAAISSSRTDVAQALLDRIEPGPHRSLVQGWLHEHSGDLERARTEYHQAYETATDQADRQRIRIALAMLGEWPLPDWEDLRETDPVQADELAALSESARGLHEEAHQRLRRHAHTSRTSAVLEAELLEESGDLEAAIEALEQARVRFHDPSFLVRAASLLYQTDRSRAQAMALRALTELPEGAADRTTMQRLLIQCAADDGDWVSVENHARSSIASGDDNPTTRWALIMALYNQGRFEDGWANLDRGAGLVPQDEIQARLWIDLHRRFDPTESTVLRILELSETYRDSEQLIGEALMAIYTMGDAVVLSDDTVGLLHAVTFDFTDRFPESSILRAVSADSPEEFISQMRERLEPGTEQFGELVQKVWSGQLPYGFLSSFVGRPYSEALVRRAAGCLPAHSEADAERDLDSARAALDQRIAIDTTALNTLSYIQRAWPDVRAAFRSLAVPRETVVDAVAGRAALSLRSTMTLGWDPSTDSPRMSEISEDEARVLSERATWIAHEILTLEVIDALQWERLTELAHERSGPWLSPLELALQQGLSLYRDDAAMRSLARSMGVATFGTVALVQALMERGHLADEDFDDILLDLASGFVVDLPLSEDGMHQLAQIEDWKPGAASFLTARPHFWSQPRVGMTRFISLYRNATHAEPSTRPTWLLAGSSGLAHALQPEAAAAAVGELLAVATASVGLWDPSSFMSSVEAAREGLGTAHQGDPLPRAIEVIFQSLIEALDHAQASKALLGLTQNLDEPDRLHALRVILQRGDE